MPEVKWPGMYYRRSFGFRCCVIVDTMVAITITKVPSYDIVMGASIYLNSGVPVGIDFIVQDRIRIARVDQGDPISVGRINGVICIGGIIL